jgi:peptidylprolyl isomerase
MSIPAKLALLTLTVPVLLPVLASAQATHSAVHHSTATASASGGACAKLPEISPKVPALPAGSPCPKPLYTITSTPSATISYTSPLENGSALRETLGIESSTFSLDYVDTKVGTGELAPLHKWYTIHYTGYLTDGTKFDSSVDRGTPISIEYGKHMVIPGWDTGFDGMRVGGKRRLYIPYQLAYGPQGKGGTIPPKAMLIFDVELVKVTDTKPEPPAPKPTTPPATTSPKQ